MVTKGGLLAVLLLSSLIAAPGPSRSDGARSTGYQDSAQDRPRTGHPIDLQRVRESSLLIRQHG